MSDILTPEAVNEWARKQRIGYTQTIRLFLYILEIGELEDYTISDLPQLYDDYKASKYYVSDMR